MLFLGRHSQALALKDEKKFLQIALKIKSPEWNKETNRQTDGQTDRLTLNFINIDMNKVAFHV